MDDMTALRVRITEQEAVYEEARRVYNYSWKAEVSLAHRLDVAITNLLEAITTEAHDKPRSAARRNMLAKINGYLAFKRAHEFAVQATRDKLKQREEAYRVLVSLRNEEFAVHVQASRSRQGDQAHAAPLVTTSP